MALKNKSNMCTLLNFFNFLKNKEKFQIITSHHKDLKISNTTLHHQEKEQNKVRRRQEIMKSSEIKQT